MQRIVSACARAPVLTLAVVAALALSGGAVATTLTPSVADSTLVSSDSPGYRATLADYRDFGGQGVIVVVHEPLRGLLAAHDVQTVSALEACLAGQVLVPDLQLGALEPAPAGALPPYGGTSSPCGRLAADRPVAAVYGPGTFLNHAVAAVSGQLIALRVTDRSLVDSAARRAYSLAVARGLGPALARRAALTAGAAEALALEAQLARIAAGVRLDGVPAISDRAFLEQIVFAGAAPRASLHYLFPAPDAALIDVRLRAGLSQAGVQQAIGLIRGATGMPRFRLLAGTGYTVAGEPVVAGELAAAITRGVLPLVLGAIASMAIALMLLFRGALRLAPLAISLAATAITFGIWALLGGVLTMASLAALPILIGLGVDYAVQYQSRVRERPELAARAALSDAARAGVPAIATAALATGAAFVVLMLSPVPMVGGFALLLVLGLAVALACALGAGSAAIALSDAELGLLGASVRGASEILRDVALRIRALAGERRRRPPSGAAAGPATPAAAARAVSRPAARVARHPRTVLAVSVVLALAGWALDARTPVQSDITRLVPANTPALRDLRALERLSGVSGQVDVLLGGPGLARPSAVRWMARYEQSVLRHFGYRSGSGCGAVLCPGFSFPDVASALRSLPEWFSRAVITPARSAAVISFGIRLMPLGEQEGVFAYMRSRLHPPPGVHAALAGMPVLASDATAALSSASRRALTLAAGLVAVALALLAVFRRLDRALLPVVPVALATGWSALVLYAIGIPLNPLSAVLGVLVIAFCTEFSVLLSERYRQELGAGAGSRGALERAYRRTGAAVLTSGVTAIAGFGVLLMSDITMLRDFGLETVVDLSVSLLGVILVLPAAMALAMGERVLAGRGTSAAR